MIQNLWQRWHWKSVKYEEVYLKDYEVCRDAREGLGKYFHFITIGGIINPWNIKHRMKFILEFLTETHGKKTARSGEKLRSVQKGNSSRPTGSFRYPSAHYY